MILRTSTSFLPRIVICSCNAYSDLWEPLLQSYKKFWPDCPFQINILTDGKIQHNAKCVIPSRKDNTPWSSVLINYLESIDEKVILLSLDDFFLKKKMETDKILELYNNFCNYDMDMLRLLPRPGPYTQQKEVPFSLLGVNEPYRVSTQASFWKTDVLKKLLLENESPWQFEINGSKRSNDFSFYGCHKSHFYYFHHDVQRGKWFPWSFLFLKLNGFKVSGTREIMNPLETIVFLAKKIIIKIIKIF